MPTQADDVPARNSGPMGVTDKVLPYAPENTVSVLSRRLPDSVTDEHIVTIHPGSPFWAFGCFATLPRHAKVSTIEVSDIGVCTMVFLSQDDK